MRKKTVIVAGLSPWDLGKGIYRQFTDHTDFKWQLSQELYSYYAAGQEYLPCPHPRCWHDESGQFTKDSLALHLHDVHGCLHIGDSHTPHETNTDSVDTADADDQQSSIEWSELEGAIAMEVQGGWTEANLLGDESQSPDALSPSYADAVQALEDARQGMDVMLHPDMEIHMSDSIECGVQFSMDGMQLRPWSADLEDAATSLENGITSQPAGSITSTDPLLASQSTYCVNPGSLMSPKCGASLLSASTAVDVNNELEYPQLSTVPHIGETFTDTIGLGEAVWAPQATSNEGEYATYAHGWHSMSQIPSLGVQDFTATSLSNQGSESGLVGKPEYGTVTINPLLDNIQLSGNSHSWWDTTIDLHLENSQTTSIPLSMDGMLIGPWTN
jgi:hypothetical protein